MARRERFTVPCLILVSAVAFAAGQKDAKPAAGTPGTAASGVPFASTLELKIMQGHRQPYDEFPAVEKEIQARTNTKITYIKVPQANFTEKLNITLASGDLPDLVHFSSTDQLATWIDQGAVIALDELLGKYGARITRWYTPEDFKNVKNPVDGKIYGVAGLSELKEINSIGIREDWLKDLGLKAPGTMAEWETTLQAFKKADPAGKGSTIPWAGELRSFFHAYGIMRSGSNGAWTVTKEGKYIPIYEHPRYREALETVRRLYAAGLVDKEYMVRNRDLKALQEPFYQGIAGSGEHAANRLEQISVSLREKKPDAKLAPIVPIKGPYGDQMILGRDRYYNRAGITVSARKAGKAEKVMQYLDWMFSDAGTELVNYGVEGKHHRKVDGKPVLLDPYNQGWDALRKDGLNYTLLTACVWSVDAYKQSLMRGKTLEQLSVTERITYDGLFLNTPYIFQPLITFDTPANRTKGPDVYPVLAEKETLAIIGDIGVDAFFAALAEVKRTGLDQITRETQELWGRL